MKGFSSSARVRFQVCRFLAAPLLVLWTANDLCALTPAEQNARSFITAQLVEHSKQLGETALTERSLLTAKPARIATVMREVLLLNEGLSTRLELKDLVTASLAADGNRTNLLKETVAFEVVKAVVDQAGITGDGARLAEVVRAALSVNSGEDGEFENANTIKIPTRQAVLGLALNAAQSYEAGRLIARDAYDFVIRSDSGGFNGVNGSEAVSLLVASLSKVTQDPRGAVSGFVEEFVRRVQVPTGDAERDYRDKYDYLTQKILTNRSLSGTPMVLGEVAGSVFKDLSFLSPADAQDRIAKDLAGLINNTIRARGSRISASLPYAVGAAVAALNPDTQSRSGLAEELIRRLLTNSQTADVRGQIFSGFLRGVGRTGSDSEVRQVLAAFLDREFDETPTKKVGKISTAKDLTTFVSFALTGNGVGAEDLQDEARKVGVTVNFVADRLSQTFIDPKTRQVDLNKAFAAADDLGTTLIGNLVRTNPNAAGAVAKGIIEGYRARGFFPEQTIVADVTMFVKNLAGNRKSFVLNNAAMSSLTGAAMGFFPSTTEYRPILDPDGNPVLDENGVPQQETILNPALDRSRLVNLSSKLIGAVPTAIVAVTSRAAEGLDRNQLPTFGSELVQELKFTSSTKATQVAQVAVGISEQDPSLAPTLTQNLILTPVSTVVRGRTVITNPLAGSADLIAGIVARAIPVEGVADIGARLSTTALTNPAISATEILQVAASLARAINEKPVTMVPGVNRLEPVRTQNRVDELGELAASLVGNVLGKSATEALELALVKDIALSVLSSLASKNSSEGLFESADAIPRMAADGTYMSGAVATILGDIAQTISYSSNISPSRKNFLLRPQSSIPSGSREATLEKLLVDAMVARSGLRGTPLTNYRNALLGVFNEVRSAGFGNLVQGEEVVGRLGETGKYEVGSVNDPETPVNNG
jgi:hypothetical protein